MSLLDNIFSLRTMIEGAEQTTRRFLNLVGFDAVATATTLTVTPRSFATHELGITASTTQTQGQRPLTARFNVVTVCANANDTVTLPPAVAPLEIVVVNRGAQTLRVFPASGDNLGAGVDTATTQVAGATARYLACDSTNWVKV
jgi:hypothetical protein